MIHNNVCNIIIKNFMYMFSYIRVCVYLNYAVFPEPRSCRRSLNLEGCRRQGAKGESVQIKRQSSLLLGPPGHFNRKSSIGGYFMHERSE